MRLWRGLRVLAVAVAVPLLLLAGALAAAWQSLHTAAGTRWWLEQAATRLPGVTLGRSEGALLGEGARLRLDRLALDLGGNRIRIDGLRLDGLQVRQWQREAPYADLAALAVAADRVSVETAPTDPAAPPSGAPTDLRLPVTLHLDRVTIGRLALPGVAAPIEDAQGRLEAGERHRLQGLSLRWQGVRLQGDAEIGAQAPLPLRARLQARSEAVDGAATLPGWARDLALDLQAQGPLARFEAQAQLSMQSQRLEASARVAPFERMPVTQLDARFSRLDLASLLAPLGLASAPQTDLAGQAIVRLETGQPLALQIEASNAAPGPWDRQRLPLERLDLRLSGQGGAWKIEQARLRFTAGAGSVVASGQLDGLDAGRLGALGGELQLALDGLRPDLIDRRGPPLRLSGPIVLRHAPAGTAGAANAAAASAAATTDTTAAAFGTLTLDARLQGSLQGAARERSPGPLRDAVELAASGSATPAGATLDTLRLRAGRAHLDGHGVLQRQGRGWRSEGQLALTDFDPALWLPGERSAPWRRGRNVLQGQADWQLEAATAPREDAGVPPGSRAPKGDEEGGWVTLLRPLRGRLEARVTDSQLAGQPVALELAVQAEASGLESHGELRAAGNRATWTATLRQPGAAPDKDRAAERAPADSLSLQIDAPSLARLAPLGQGLGLGPLSGTATLDARIDGALGAWLPGWSGAAADRAGSGTPGAPSSLGAGPLISRGSLHLASLRLGDWQLQAADADWDGSLPGAAAIQGLGPGLLKLQMDLRELHLPGLRVPQAALQADGSLASHRASLRASLVRPDPVGRGRETAPDAAAEAAATPLVLEATLAGQWQGGAGGSPARWQVQIPSVLLQPSPGSLGRTLTGLATRLDHQAGGSALQPLLQARGLALELRHDAARWRIEVQPGQTEVLGTRLRWRSAWWERDGGAPPRMALDAEIDPLRVADLLQRLQPEFGWGGDLRVGAKAQLQASPDFSARIEIARIDGDLQLSEFGAVQSLALTEGRLELVAEGGLWRLTELIDGRNLGRLSGEQTLRTGPQDSWPDAQAPIEGQLNAHVDNLGAWGGWVPAGWRLAGQVDAALRVAGRLGAPELIGEVSGHRIGLRNALEGVVLTDGELDLRFDGDTARLGQLRFKAGGGSLALSGEARLGETPQLDLQLQADRATLLGRVDRRVVASGRASVRADAQQLTVDGSVRVDEGLIDITRSDAPSLGDDISVRRRGADAAANEAAADAAARRPARAVVVNLGIDLGQRLVLRGRGIDTRLGGDLRLTTTGGRLAARGEVRTEGGTYEAYGQKLEIARGVITFVGPIDNPRLDIEAVRARSDVRVGVTVGGSVQSPRVRLFSDPDLPATEKLALLVTGRSYDSLAGADTLLLQRAAFALLAGDGSGAVDFNVARLLQLDELSVRQSDGVLRDTIFTLGKQISDRVYVGYERGLNAATGNWQLIYRIAQRFTLRAQSGDDSALDLIWLFRWN